MGNLWNLKRKTIDYKISFFGQFRSTIFLIFIFLKSAFLIINKIIKDICAFYMAIIFVHSHTLLI